MRLLFLCSSLEPSRDGVGDYTRRLAEECVKLGHTCALVALNDSYVSAPAETIETGGLNTLRIPPQGDWTVAADFRERFAPDWISLQLVAYGLHPRGMLFQATSALRRVTGPARLHLMLHELWVGNEKRPTLRHRVTGSLQKRSLRRMLEALRPVFVSTTNPFYAALLKSIGVDAAILPLFGNILIAAHEPLPEAVAAYHRPGKTWLGVFFGALYGEWKPEPFLGRLKRAAEKAGRSVVLAQMGHPGAEGSKIWQELEREYAASFRFLRLGPQQPEAVSAILRAADFGIATSPWVLIGKSGSAAVMLDHGLPVIVTRDDFQPAITSTLPPTTDPLVHRDRETLELMLATGLPKREPCASAPAFAAKWTAELAARAGGHA
jgi:hypothetical protein